MNLNKLYKKAKEYKDTHDHCGAEPYLDYHKLFQSVENNRPGNILELGTGIGFTAIVMSLANPESLIDSLETNSKQILAAKKWTRELGITNVNFIQNDVHKVLPYLESDKYSFIFFDVYGPKERFLTDFERIMRPGGILYSVNAHLKSAEPEYFENLEKSISWEKLDEFNDTKIYRKLL